MEKDLRIVTTYFQHLEIHTFRRKPKYHQMAEQLTKQDHVPIESKHLKYILDARSCREADVDIDYVLIRAKIAKARKLWSKKQEKRERNKISRWKN